MKQSQGKQSKNQLPCVLCRRIRIIAGVVIIALAILAVKGELSFIRGVSLTRIAADLVNYSHFNILYIKLVFG